MACNAHLPIVGFSHSPSPATPQPAPRPLRRVRIPDQCLHRLHQQRSLALRFSPTHLLKAKDARDFLGLLSLRLGKNKSSIFQTPRLPQKPPRPNPAPQPHQTIHPQSRPKRNRLLLPRQHPSMRCQLRRHHRFPLAHTPHHHQAHPARHTDQNQNHSRHRRPLLPSHLLPPHMRLDHRRASHDRPARASPRLILIIRLPKHTLHPRHDLIPSLPRPFRITPPHLRRGKINHMMRPARQHLTIDLQALPNSPDPLLVIHLITPPMPHPPTSRLLS